MDTVFYHIKLNRKLAEKLKLNDIERVLNEKGWESKKYLREWTIWDRRLYYKPSVYLPDNEDCSDYGLRISEMLETVSKFYEVSELRVYLWMRPAI